jgi:hypothetical protein
MPDGTILGDLQAVPDLADEPDDRVFAVLWEEVILALALRVSVVWAMIMGADSETRIKASIK